MTQESQNSQESEQAVEVISPAEENKSGDFHLNYFAPQTGFSAREILQLKTEYPEYLERDLVLREKLTDAQIHSNEKRLEIADKLAVHDMEMEKKLVQYEIDSESREREHQLELEKLKRTQSNQVMSGIALLAVVLQSMGNPEAVSVLVGSTAVAIVGALIFGKNRNK